jgi:hypothetical protein
VDLVHAFSKGVKDVNIIHHTISDFGIIGKIGDIVGKLENLHNAQSCLLEDIGLNTNRKEWVIKLLGYPGIGVDEDIVRFLLRDFTENMKTRMKEETKYAIGVLSSNRFLLCHSVFGGETITPAWDIIPRMLDTDNVLRFASFRRDNQVAQVTYWEGDPSQSFIEWLGLKRKKTFLSGGAFKIVSRIAGMTTELQLDEKEIDELIKDHPEFLENKISFASPIHLLVIDEIKIGSRHYETSEDFLQVYTADKYGVLPYMEKYAKLMKSYSPVVIKYLDDEGALISVSDTSGKENVEVEKELKGIEILFVNQYIDLRPAYRDKLVARIVNNDNLRLFHAGCEFSHSPFTLKNVQILNKIKTDDLVKRLTEFYNDVNLQDKTLDSIVKYAVFGRLAAINGDLPIVHFFFEVMRGVLEIAGIKEKRWTKGEGAVLEYKSSDCLKGEDSAVISELANDMNKKLKLNYFKIYIIGVEENGALDPISKSRLPNDRLESIRAGLYNELKQLGEVNIYPARIPFDNKYLLVIAVNLKPQPSHGLSPNFKP